MYNKKSMPKIDKSTGWDDAIATTRRQIKKLETAIEVFKERKAAGEQWPTQNLATHN